MKDQRDTGEIIKTHEVRWKTHLSQRVQQFADTISDDEVFEKYFGGPYVEKLTSKSKSIASLVLKLTLVYVALMLSLFAFHSISDLELEIFGYGFKNIASYKELFLFLAVTISPIIAILTAYKKYIDALINECLKKMVPDASARKFFSHKFVDDYFDWLMPKNIGPSTYWHGLADLLIIIYILALLLFALTLIAGTFLIQISVIYSVAKNPALPQYVNFFVLAYAVVSILCSWLISIIQFPMPEIYFGNLYKLNEIKKSDPEKYDHLMRKMAARNSKRELISIMVSSFVIYIATFTCILLYWQPTLLSDLGFVVREGMLGAFIVIFFSNELVGIIRRRVWTSFFKKYSESDPAKLKLYGYLKKLLLLVRMAVPIAISIAYTSYALSAIN